MRSPKKSRVAKRSVKIGGRHSSMSLETAFWEALKEIAARQEISVSTLVSRIDAERQHANLSSTIRLFVLDHYRRLAEEKTKR